MIINRPKIQFFINFLAFFLVFYFEVFELGGVKLAVLWKAAFILILFFDILNKGSSFRFQRLVLWGGLFSFESFWNYSLTDSPLDNLSESMKNIYIPIIVAAFGARCASLVAAQKVYLAMLDVSTFVILSGFPFLIGVLEPVGVGYDLTLFGLDGNGFIGLFQTAHTSSISIGFALIVLFFHLNNNFVSAGQKLWLFSLVGIGVLSMYMTYVRTGYFVLIVGLVAVLFSTRAKFPWVKVVALSICLIFAGFVLFENSEVFRLRMLGLNVHTEESQAGGGGVGSGREQFWVAALTYFSEQDIPVQIFGLGSSVGKALMEKAVGIRIYAHNGFVDVLQFNGYLGLLIYLGFLYCIALEVLKSRLSPNFPLVVALFSAYLAQMLVQGERVFIADVLFALSLIVVKKFPPSSQVMSSAPPRSVSRSG